MPGDIVEDEETGATTLQESVQEQQLLAMSAPAPPEDEGQGATGATAEATTVVEAEGETSTPFFPLPDQDNEKDEGEENPDEDDDQDEMPDEAFLLEGASSTLVCSISFKLMTSAVVAMDTHSYQREALEAWVERCKSKGVPLTSPLTNAPMGPLTMTNQTVRVLVSEHIDARLQAWRELLAGRRKVRSKERKETKKEGGGGAVTVEAFFTGGVDE